MTDEKFTTLSSADVDEINHKINETLAMVEVLSQAVLSGDPTKRLYTFTSLLEGKIVEIQAKFERATSKDKEMA